MGLARLLDTSSHRLLNQACAEATRRGAWRLRDVRALLGARESQPHFAFAESHPLIRDLNEYGIFIKTHCQT